jgi:GNAT superfamily N-acetyltransferase
MIDDLEKSGTDLSRSKVGDVNLSYLNPTYNFIRARQLEGTYPGQPQLGVWPITSNRVAYGWGYVTIRDWPLMATGENWPPVEEVGLDKAAKSNRIKHYQRARSLLECKLALNALRPPITSYEVSDDWDHSETGLIPEPSPKDIIAGSHAVPMLAYDDLSRIIRFPNSWGPDWGDEGWGTLSYKYFEERSVESWFLTPGDGTKFLSDRLTRGRDLTRESSHQISLSWGTRDVLTGGVAHAAEVYDYQNDERLAWSFFVERCAFLEIEEFYVRPQYRGQGHANTICREILRLADQLELIPKLWISFADCELENRPALDAMIRRLGLSMRNTNERWAAYVALPGRPTRNLEPIRIPPRPEKVRRVSRVTTATAIFSGIAFQAAPSLSSPTQLFSSAPTTLEAELDVSRATTPAVSISPPAQAIGIKEIEHMEFLMRISSEGSPPPISKETAALAAELWHLISQTSEWKIPVPAAAAGPDGKVFYAWNTKRHHLEAEIIPGQHIEFFYRDRETGECWGEDYEPGSALPPQIISTLSYF